MAFSSRLVQKDQNICIVIFLKRPTNPEAKLSAQLLPKCRLVTCAITPIVVVIKPRARYGTPLLFLTLLSSIPSNLSSISSFPYWSTFSWMLSIVFTVSIVYVPLFCKGLYTSAPCAHYTTHMGCYLIQMLFQIFVCLPKCDEVRVALERAH